MNLNHVVPITALYAAILALLVVALAFPIIRLRFRYRVGLGDGGKEDLQRAVRAHGNAVEYIPLFLILLALLEANQGGTNLLHGLGIAFVLARLSHAWGIHGSAGTSPGRFIGTVTTFSVIIVLAVANICRVLT